MLKPQTGSLLTKVTTTFIVFEPTKSANVVIYHHTQETYRNTHFLHHKERKSSLHHELTLH
jgi:hypothetical protein